MQVPGERERLADALWRGDWAETDSPLAAANPDMCDFFELQSVDSGEVRKHRQLASGRSRWEGVLTSL
eukprot:2501838-Pleurochrysis_carterae.AAC.1